MAEKLTLRFVRDVTFKARVKWYALGVSLGLSVDTLEVIKEESSRIDDRHQEMLRHWLKGTNPEPTGEALVEALKSPAVGEIRLANEVERKLQELQHHQRPSSEGAFFSLKSKWVRAIVEVLVRLVLLVMALRIAMNSTQSTSGHGYSATSSGVSSKPVSSQIPESARLPYPIHVFIGREADMKEIIQQLESAQPNNRIISIVGPPGFGKSTLAIHIGHRMLADGVLVYYVDMREISSMKSLAEKIVHSTATIGHLFTWASELHKNRTILIFDNCDDMLQNQANYSELQNVVKQLLKKSLTLRVLITSRLRVLVELNQFTHSLHGLSSEESCELLQNITSSHNTTILDSNTCVAIANLTGNTPLAVQVIGALLNQPDHPEPLTIVAKLEKDPISTTSTGKLPEEYCVNASISLSYDYLTPALQNVGKYLANFPGSFDEEAACKIAPLAEFHIACSGANGFLISLVDRSLLEYSQHTERYQFHRLIQKFFLHIQTSTDQLYSRYFDAFYLVHYGLKLQSYFEIFTKNPAEALLKFDAERHNFLWLFTYSEIYCNIPILEFLGHERILITIHIFVESRSLLEFRFTGEEMSVFHQTIITYIVQNWRILYELFSDHGLMISTYVCSILKLANFRDVNYNTSYGLKTIASQQDVIEELYSLHPTGPNVMSSYLVFYGYLKSYYIKLEQYENEYACQEKISQRMKEYQPDWISILSIKGL